ncbi:5-methyltetrahydropteroyltriglutamate--homocysteine S-methyltransferase [Gordonia shandongensis]|uniref:5-methyltetrahydropteroyltriglutamate-- homocysteine S-methyltransferase n=1 Tax=Gordonia shandongensis TaxID=376351 RepID=UPI000424056A|nr:5-methyltetrahydropteroyltriglutamate--homocysteine S-methyltransferase [Gordonia shandongensis]
MSDTTPVSPSPAPFAATVPGIARIGADRELKRAVEAYWAGRIDAAALAGVGAAIRRDGWHRLVQAGHDSVPVGTFSYYDQMLDTAEMLGALPPRVASIDAPLDRYFAAARGTAEVAPLDTTGWFDTNYAHVVPEIGPETEFALDPSRLLAELAEAVALGMPARPVVIGPITFLALATAADGGPAPMTRIDEVVDLYVRLLAVLHDAGAPWVQIDEPILVTDLVDDLSGLARRVYARLAADGPRPPILVQTYFGDLGDRLDVLLAAGVEGIGVDLVSGAVPAVDHLDLTSTHLVAGVVDGRNVWRTDLDRAADLLEHLRPHVGSLAVSTSCSTLHVPYTLRGETDLDPALHGWLAFADEKFAEVAVLARAHAHGRDDQAVAFEVSRAALASRASDARLHVTAVADRLAALRPADWTRSSVADRRIAQDTALNLPPLTTTTIGSYPQTRSIRETRRALRTGSIDYETYRDRIQQEIAEVIALQERVGLDVLVHGEPERNDMVQYFAEQLDGFFATRNGWVQATGSLCVRPPILFGDVSRPGPMTVGWTTYAQSLTTKPLKAMLTGPVTILGRSFVRDDQPRSDTADQIALAVRDEVADLERAGVPIIQVDEPALRELLPLHADRRADYLARAVRSFRIATGGVADSTQIHTHLCYSDFAPVIGAITEMDADVTSIEAARSHMEILSELVDAGFDGQVGPGVYDVHSPQIPSIDHIVDALAEALAVVSADRLWVNPDCGLKTRTVDEARAALRALVVAARTARSRARELAGQPN